MDMALLLHSGEAHHVTTPPARFVLIYDRFDTAVRGKVFCDQLAGKLDAPTDLGESLWRSDLLNIPEIRQEAARAALAADFVVLSLRGDEPLSTTLYRWFGEWMPHAHDRDLTCIVLFDPVAAQREATNHVLSFLREAARASDVHFFAHTTITDGETVGVEPTPGWMEPRRPRSSGWNGMARPSISAHDGIRIATEEEAGAR